MTHEYAERQWNIDKKKPKKTEKIPSQCNSLHHKCHVDWPGSEPVPQLREAGD
jgi:hypothetical protein